MSGSGQEWCSCEQEGMSFQDLTNHYCESFLPEKWKLCYDFLDRPAQESYLYLCGKCTRCWKNARAGVGIAPAESGEVLMERVYQEMLRYRPFDGKDPVTGIYRGAVRERSRWYQRQDDLTAAERSEQFVSLFLPEDQERARQWVQQHHGAEAYTKPRRDRKSTLFLAALERARADGSMDGIDLILEYHLPNVQEPAFGDQDTYLTNYRFNVVPAVEYGGSEGIYVAVYLEGEFDSSGKTRTEIGCFKTLERDLEACRKMGELCGVMMHHATAYVNENLHRYTPEKELEAEYQRKLKKEGGLACGQRDQL